MRLQVELTRQEFLTLWNRATREIHFLREEPRKSWTDKERREAIAAWLRKKAESAF